MPLGTSLNGGPVSQLRGLQWLALSEVGSVGVATSVSDGGGGVTQTWAYGDTFGEGTLGEGMFAGLTVPCRVDPINARVDEGLVAGRLDARSTHLITVPAGTAVSTNDRFAVSSRGIFEVTAVRDRTAEWTHSFEAVEVS